MRALASLLGICPASICMYESGKRVPDIYMIDQIAKNLGVSISKLLGDEPYSAHEIAVIDGYRKTSKDMRNRVDELLNIGS